MTRILASGAASAMALARSRTMLALVLNRSTKRSIPADDQDECPCTITSHPRFSGDSSRNEHNVCTLERILETIIGWFMAGDLGSRIDMTDIGSDTYQGSLNEHDYD